MHRFRQHGGGAFLIMTNYKLIQEAFKGLIGFKKSYDSADKEIDEDLQESSSGIFVNNLHDLFTIKNLSAIIQSPDNLVTVAPYNNATTYKIGDIVKHSNKIYVSLVDDNTNQNPDSQPTKWKQTTLLSQFLLEKYNHSVNQVVQKFLSFKKGFLQSKELLERVALFDSFGGDHIEKTGSFVGYQIDILSPMLANTIKKVGIQLLENDTLTIYLFHSSQTNAIATKEITYTNAKRFQWFSLDNFLLKKVTDSYEDGYFTIGYFESDLSATNRAINAKVNFGDNYGCATCQYSNLRLIELWSQFYKIRPIQIQSQLLSGTTQSWGFEDAMVSDTMNYGLNLVFSVECDFTDVIIKNKDLFIPVLSEQLRITFLNAIANTQRHNPTSTEAANLANYWLKEGKYDKALLTALENASFDLSSLDKNCLPCEKTDKAIQHEVLW